MAGFLTSTNVMIGIVAGLITIFGTIVGVLRRRQTALKTIDYQRPEVQIEIREWLSVPGIIWRTWMGILFGLVFAAMFTVVPDFVITGFMTVINNMQTDRFAQMDFSNPILFAICAIFGVSIGISAALTMAAPGRFARYGGRTSRSMLDSSNRWG
jgi:hypothetical protein